MRAKLLKIKITLEDLHHEAEKLIAELEVAERAHVEDLGVLAEIVFWLIEALEELLVFIMREDH